MTRIPRELGSLALGAIVALGALHYRHTGYVLFAPTVHAQGGALSMTVNKKPAPKSVPIPRLRASDVTVVNLPTGQKFVSMMPSPMGSIETRNVMYLTEDRSAGEQPRFLTIWGPGSSPYTWRELLYIQEH